MVNQELLSYIRQQLSQKVAKDVIKTNLMSQGWLDHDIAEGFVAIEGSAAVPISPWTKSIAKTNKVFMIISLILVFGVDLLILISSPSLASFWYMMLGVLAVFAVFFYLENFVFSKKFAGTTARVDKGIGIVVVLRNLLFILNFIPFIQLLGLAAIVYGGWLLGIIYIVLIISRFKQTKKIGLYNPHS